MFDVNIYNSLLENVNHIEWYIKEIIHIEFKDNTTLIINLLIYISNISTSNKVYRFTSMLQTNWVRNKVDRLPYWVLWLKKNIEIIYHDNTLLVLMMLM